MRWYVMICVVLLLAACGRQTPARVPPQTPSGEAATGIEGRVISISDVATVPDIVLGDVGLAVFEQSALDTQGSPLDRFSAEVESPQTVTATTTTDQQGAYGFTLPPGDYYVCLAGFDVQQVQAPFTLSGCVEAQVRAGERLLLDLGWGEGGLYAY